MTKYSSFVKLEFDGNNFEAETKKEYIQKVIDSFKEEYNIDLYANEIHNIEEEKENE
tara:strand:+ start:160 stop:330 length:171 start_codon:yes stop_codon:yes gene_type:complete